jgi:rhodanese-related sulfurtransferase
MKNLLIILGCVAVAVAVVVVGIYKKGGSQVTTEQGDKGTIASVVLETVSGTDFAAKWREMSDTGAKLIDVRTPGEYTSGHYENAEMVDFYAEDFASKMNALDKDVQYFIYCRSGSRSGQTLRLMQDLGFTKVYDLAGGIGGNVDILPIVAQ